MHRCFLSCGRLFFYAGKTHNRGFREVFRGDQDFYDPQIVLIHRIRNIVVLKKSKWNRNKIHWKNSFHCFDKKRFPDFCICAVKLSTWADLVAILETVQGYGHRPTRHPCQPTCKRAGYQLQSINHIWRIHIADNTVVTSLISDRFLYERVPTVVN